MVFPKASAESPQMFESRFIDAFSRVHPGVVPAIYVPASVATFWLALDAGVAVVSSVGLLLVGWLIWTLTEYWLHRTLFHWVPKTRWGEQFHFIVHGVHHKWPRDKYRLVMVPAISIPVYLLFAAVFVGLFGSYGWAMHTGFTVGYMCYDMTHYYIHHHAPKNRWFKALRKNHMLHHFKDHDTRFCVSNLLWDRVFGTR